MLKKIVIGLGVLILLLVGVAFVLPSNAKVERTIEIEGSPEAVFAIVNDFQRFNDWSPWALRDPNAKFSVEGPAGVGQKMSWDSEQDDVGSGTNTITKSESPKLLETALDFGDMGQAKSHFIIEPKDGKCSVTWGFETDLGMNPMMRYMGLMMDSWVGADYDLGLKQLKALVEKGETQSAAKG